MPFGRFVAEAVSKHLNNWFEDINEHQFHFHWWNGQVVLQDLRLKTKEVNVLLSNLGLFVTEGLVKRLEFSIFSAQQGAVSLSLEGIHLKCKDYRQDYQTDSELQNVQGLFGHSFRHGLLLSEFEVTEASHWKGELVSLLAALVAIDIKDFNVFFDYFVEEKHTLLFHIDEISIYDHQESDVVVTATLFQEEESFGNISKEMLFKRCRLTHNTDYSVHPQTILVWEECLVYFKAVLQQMSNSFYVSCSSWSFLNLNVSVMWIESVLQLIQKRKEEQANLYKFHCGKPQTSDSLQSMACARWKFAIRYLVIYFIRPIRDYYRIYLSCCYRWVRLKLLEEGQQCALTFSQKTFLYQMERMFHSKCIDYLRECHNLLVLTTFHRPYDFSIISEETLAQYFRESIFFNSTSWHPLIQSPSLQLDLLQQGVCLIVSSEKRSVCSQWGALNGHLLLDCREKKVSLSCFSLEVSSDASLSESYELVLGTEKSHQLIVESICQSDMPLFELDWSVRNQDNDQLVSYLQFHISSMKVFWMPTIHTFLKDDILPVVSKNKQNPFGDVDLIWLQKQLNLSRRGIMDWFLKVGIMKGNIQDWQLIFSFDSVGHVRKVDFSFNGIDFDGDHCILEVKIRQLASHRLHNGSLFRESQNLENGAKEMKDLIEPFDCILTFKNREEDLDEYECYIPFFQLYVTEEDWIDLLGRKECSVKSNQRPILSYHCLQCSFHQLQVSFTHFDISSSLLTVFLQSLKVDWDDSCLLSLTGSNQYSEETGSVKWWQMVTNEWMVEWKFEIMLPILYIDFVSCLDFLKCFIPLFSSSANSQHISLRRMNVECRLEKIICACPFAPLVSYQLVLDRIRLSWRAMVNLPLDPNDVMEHTEYGKFTIFIIVIEQTERNIVRDNTWPLLKTSPLVLEYSNDTILYITLTRFHLNGNENSLEWLVNWYIYLHNSFPLVQSNSEEISITSKPILFPKLTFSLEDFQIQWQCYSHELTLHLMDIHGWFEKGLLLSNEEEWLVFQVGCIHTTWNHLEQYSLFALQLEDGFEWKGKNNPFLMHCIATRKILLHCHPFIFSFIPAIVSYMKQQIAQLFYFHKNEHMESTCIIVDHHYGLYIVVDEWILSFAYGSHFSMTSDWNIERLLIVYDCRNEMSYIGIDFRWIFATMRGVQKDVLWSYKENNLLVSIIPSHQISAEEKYGEELQAIRIHYWQQENNMKVNSRLRLVQWQLNWESITFLLDYHQRILQMMNEMEQLEQMLQHKNTSNPLEKASPTINNVIGEWIIDQFHANVIEYRDNTIQPLVVLQMKVRNTNVGLLSGKISIRWSKMNIWLDDVDIKETHDNVNLQHSFTSECSSSEWSVSMRISPSTFGSHRKQYKASLKLNAVFLEIQLQYVCIHVSDCILRISCTGMNNLKRWLHSLLPTSKSDSTAGIPNMQVTLLQAMILVIDDEWEGLPLCKGLISLQANSKDEQLDASLQMSGIEIYNLIHLSLEPFIEDWMLQIYIRPKQANCFHSLLCEENSFYRIHVGSSKLLQVNLNPPMVACLCRLWTQFLQPTIDGSGCSVELFSVSNQTGDCIHIHMREEYESYQVAANETISLNHSIASQGFFYFSCPLISKRVTLSFDGPYLSFCIASETNLYLIIEKQITNLHTLLKLRSNYLIENVADCSLLVVCMIGNEMVEEWMLVPGERWSLPLYMLLHQEASFYFCLQGRDEWISERYGLKDCFENVNGCFDLVKKNTAVRMTWYKQTILNDFFPVDRIIRIMPVVLLKNLMGWDISCLDCFSQWKTVLDNDELMLYETLNNALELCIQLRKRDSLEEYKLVIDRPLERTFHEYRLKGKNYFSIACSVREDKVKAWIQVIIHPDIVVKNQLPCGRLEWQWITNQDVYDFSCRETLAMAPGESLCFTMVPYFRRYQMTWKCSSSGCHFTSDRIFFHWGQHEVCLYCSQSDSSIVNFDNYIMMENEKDTISLQVDIRKASWRVEELKIPHIFISPRYIFENGSLIDLEFIQGTRKYTLERYCTKMVSKMWFECQFNDMMYVLAMDPQHQSRCVGSFSIAQVVGMEYHCKPAIYPMKHVESHQLLFYLHIEYSEQNLQRRLRFSTSCCLPSMVKVLNASHHFCRIVYESQTKTTSHLLCSGQYIQLLGQEIIQSNSGIHLYGIENGQSSIWIGNFSPFSMNQKETMWSMKRNGWLVHLIRMGPHWYGWINKEKKKIAFSQQLPWIEYAYQQMTMDFAGIGITIYTTIQQEVLYMQLEHLRMEIKGTEEGYIWSSFSIQDVHIDNQFTNIGKEYCVLMERDATEGALIEGILRGYFGQWKQHSRDALFQLDKVHLIIRPWILRWDMDMLFIISEWWSEWEWLTRPNVISRQPNSSKQNLNFLVYIEQLYFSDIFCKLSLQFGKKGVNALLKSRFYPSHQLAWEKWITLFAVSVGSLKEAPLHGRSVVHYHRYVSSQWIRGIGKRYIRDLLIDMYLLVSSLNWIGNPRRILQRWKTAWQRFFIEPSTAFMTPQQLPLILFKACWKLSYQMLDSWMEGGVAVLQGTADCLLGLTQSLEKRWIILNTFVHIHHRLCMEWIKWGESLRQSLWKIGSWLNCLDDEWIPQRKRPIGNHCLHQPLKPFDLQDNALGNQLLQQWERRLEMERLILFAPFADEMGLVCTNYRYICIWYASSLWKGIQVENPKWFPLWELWNEQILHIDRMGRNVIGFTVLSTNTSCQIVSRKKWKTFFKKGEYCNASKSIIDVQEIICQNEQVAVWWLKQWKKRYFESSSNGNAYDDYLIYRSTERGHVFPKISGFE